MLFSTRQSSIATRMRALSEFHTVANCRKAYALSSYVISDLCVGMPLLPTDIDEGYEGAG